MKRWLFFLAVVTLGSGPSFQDSDEEFTNKVQGLIAQLREAGTRKKAEAELIKLGPRVLPVLRKEVSRAEGDVKSRLEGIIRTLEAAERRHRAQGKSMTVKVSAQDSPLSEIARSLQSSTGVPIDLQGGIKDVKLTLEAPSLSLWEALDKICRAQGNLAWDASDKGVTLREGKPEGVVTASASGYALLLREFERRSSDGPMGKRDTINSSAYVAGPPGAVMCSGHVTFQVLVDDRGTNLMKSPGPSGTASIGGFKIYDDPLLSRPFYESLGDLQNPSPAKDATKVKVCRGVAFVRVVVEMRKGVELRGPAIKSGAKASAAGIALKIVEASVSDGVVRMIVEVTDSNITVKKDRNALYPETGGKVILRDSRGVDIGAKVEPDTGTTTMSGPAMSYDQETTTFKVEGTIESGGSLAAIEVWEPSDIEEIKIPFDLKDIPIRKVK